MRRPWWIVVLLVAVVGGGMLAALLRGGAGEEAKVVAEPEVALSVSSTPIREGERAWYSLSVGLMPRQETTLRFSTAQRFDFAVYAPDAKTDREPAWRWSAGRMFAQVIGQETYEGERLYLFAAAWDGTGSDGRPLPPGRYRLEGRVTASPQPLVAYGWVEVR
ncbi:BsuPI-related putative proteinase inhibitor [Limnochorda pilosa]|uniref:Intracellular proteinase inhibitor BsuPI domain-containing protein n=1 Tax=Limnochorda pilosa TaxID=1555112 RepID=A0A0K2SPE2_LIMPI|nr:BsuPI-related putative proteinase inhibitor [Limnochorda pilosa]BAS28674.1 hypothetical protein LIP_2845 [Limnochorda pilosa]